VSGTRAHTTFSLVSLEVGVLFVILVGYAGKLAAAKMANSLTGESPSELLALTENL